jgi:hypothetical protein
MDEIEKHAFEKHRDNLIALSDLMDYHDNTLTVKATRNDDYEWEIQIVELNGRVLGKGAHSDHDTALADAIADATE